MKIKVLFVALHRPDRSPSQRFRYEQYLTYLSENGFQCDLSYLLNAQDDRVFYQPGHYVDKFRIFVKSYLHRLRDVVRATKYDIIFVQREAFMTGTTFFEKEFSRSGAKLIFDFDDAIWLPNVSAANANLAFLKNPAKTEDIIYYSDMIFAGNAYLADYALRFNSCVKWVPTTVDTDEYAPNPARRNPNTFTIGWSGSPTTVEHFETALPALAALKEKYGDQIQIRVCGDGAYRHEALGITGIPWRRDTEVSELETFDVGLMPLPDNIWALGKCGLKGLLTMSMEIPTIMSPVGVNKDIIQDGQNGLLASTTEDWIAKIELLMHNPQLRNQIAQKGRQTVLEKYSVYAQRDNYVRFFHEALEGH